LRKILRALAPGVSVSLAAVLVLMLIPAEVARIVEDYALVAYGAGLALAWVFRRSRAFVALALLIWLDIIVFGGPGWRGLLLVLGTVAIAVIGALGIVRDRGVASRWGLVQVLLSSAVAFAAGVVFADPARVGLFTSGRRLFFSGPVIVLGYPVETLAVVAAALIATGRGLYRYRGPIERALIWAVLLITTAMHPALPGDGPALFLMAAGLVLTLGMVETSYVLAYQDELTGLPGRRALMQYLGHDVGDQVLKLVAGQLEGAPGGARAYRYGGEEFALIFPGRSSDEAWPYLEDVRASIDDATFTVRSWKRPMKKPTGDASATASRPKLLSVTVSLGVADTAKDPSPEAALKKADEALYRAKNKGRNHVSK
jgi:diguanylate cyclase (GGDEF)-like protein